MLVNITYKNLRNVTFPIYPLPIGEDMLSYQDGLLLAGHLVIDDRNINKDTLPMRRLHSPHKLKKLPYTVFDVTGLLHTGKTCFIDNRGNLFKYTKTQFHPVKYKRIKRIEYKDSESLIWVHGEQGPLRVPRPPPRGHTWAGILYLFGVPSFVYEYTEDKLPDTRKKV